MEIDMKSALICDTESDTRADKLKLIADTYGLKNQRIQAVQELSEVTILLTRRSDQIEKDPTYKEHLTEEIADTFVMLEQIMYLQGIPKDDVSDMIDFKINRQLERMKKER